MNPLLRTHVRLLFQVSTVFFWVIVLPVQSVNGMTRLIGQGIQSGLTLILETMGRTSYFRRNTLLSVVSQLPALLADLQKVAERANWTSVSRGISLNDGLRLTALLEVGLPRTHYLMVKGGFLRILSWTIRILLKKLHDPLCPSLTLVGNFLLCYSEFYRPIFLLCRRRSLKWQIQNLD